MNDPQDKKTLEMVEIVVDGRPVLAPKGSNLLEALIEAGEDMSYFCYHPGLSVVAQCRQCLVGVGDGVKLAPSCQLSVEPGLKIRSKTEEVLEARRAMLEYTLVNHPVDCVICDKAGECTLQRHYMDWDGKPAAINHQKVHKPKRVDIGPEIVLDAERCILCSRCIRFCAEFVGRPQLVFAERGDHTVLTTAPGEQLDNPYSLNTVDICPVGALTDKDFRFQSRVWDLFATRSTCNGCAALCETELHHKGGRIYRMVPPKRWDMNDGWMCDYGRRTYKAVHAEQRLAAPSVDGQPVELNAATRRVTSLLAPLVQAEGSPIGVVLGADATNEDNYVARLLAEALRASLYLADRPDDGQGDAILRRDDPNPNRAGAIACASGVRLRGREELFADAKAGRLRAIYAIGDSLSASDEAGAAFSGVELVMQAAWASPLVSRATVVLPAAAWAEVDGTLLDDRGHVKRLRRAFEPPGHAQPHWKLTCELAGALGTPMPFASAFEVFAALRGGVELFRPAQWGKDLPTTRLRWAGRRG